jgi:glycerol-3-phosphate dehydrogenase
LKLTRDDVHYTYAGIQPVSCDPKDPKGTREIRIHDLSGEGFPCMLMLTGGPIMTYRIIGSELADAVAKLISPSGSAQAPSYFPSAITEQLHKEKGGHSMVFRRSDMGWDLDQGRAKLEAVAKIMAEILGWDAAQLQEQLCSYVSYIEENFPRHH